MPPLDRPPITNREEWNAAYWFTPLQTITVCNPLPNDYPFMVEGRHFMLKAGESRAVPGTIANVFLSNMSRLLAQNEDKLEHMSDFNLMAQYYDRLIMDKTDAMEQFDTTPAYLRSATQASPAPNITPPWENPPLPTVNVAPPAPEPKEEVKEFELEGSKFRMSVDKNGNTGYFRDGRRISEAEYSKNASMA